MAATCYVCGKTIHDAGRTVLVSGRHREEYCSEPCLRESLRARRIAAARAWRRWLLGLVVIAMLPAAAGFLWRFHLPQVEVISSTPTGGRVAAAGRGPVVLGPAWPPTDDDWMFAFARSSWIYPLPGPIRRAPSSDGRIFGPEPPKGHASLCREPGRCGADLGGELWGEHVYAVHDGVVDRVQGQGGEEHGGLYVRLSHFGGMVFTQYFHLAATPRGLYRGVHVKAGDVIGLVGDTGLRSTTARRHLTFALSIRPSSDFAETYWDPTPWMAAWPLRLPAHGTVAGLAPADRDTEPSRRRRSR